MYTCFNPSVGIVSKYIYMTPFKALACTAVLSPWCNTCSESIRDIFWNHCYLYPFVSNNQAIAMNKSQKWFRSNDSNSMSSTNWRGLIYFLWNAHCTIMFVQSSQYKSNSTLKHLQPTKVTTSLLQIIVSEKRENETSKPSFRFFFLRRIQFRTCSCISNSNGNLIRLSCVCEWSLPIEIVRSHMTIGIK